MGNMKGKKGQLGNLQGIILTVVIVGLLIGVGFLIFRSLEKTMGTTINTVLNESITVTNGLSPSTSYLAYNSTTGGVYCYNSLSITNVKNASGGLEISSGNYTYNPDTGNFYNLTSTTGSWNVSYTYKSGTEGCKGVQDTETAFKNVNTFLPILIIVAIVGILLAIVFGVLGRSGGASFGGGGRTAEV